MSYLRGELGINMWGVKLNIMFQGSGFFKTNLNIVLGSHNSPS